MKKIILLFVFTLVFGGLCSQTTDNIGSYMETQAL